MSIRIRVCGTVALALLLRAAPPLSGQATPPAFRVEEASIAQIRSALDAGTLTCRALVHAYLDRIAAYDKNGPALNALVVVNPDALRVADSLDTRMRGGAPLGPLHCVPVIVKDNFETLELPTTGGSLSLEGFVSGRDAFQVRQIRAAGAIVLAKSNMAEFAFSPVETIGSTLPGYTKNPYALDRVTAGSSGGTAAAVAASFGAVGLGTDTGNSIRGPSSHQALVGIRSTRGLTSRAGVIPLNLAADIAGPMARTVADAVAVFQVVVGRDPDDAVTEALAGRTIPDYATALVRDGLKGARIGVLRQAYERPTADPEVLAVFDRALEDLRLAGAIVVDTVMLPELDSIRAPLVAAGGCNRFKFDVEQWMASTPKHPPIQSLDSIIKSARFHPSIQKRLEDAQAVADPPDRHPGCVARDRLVTQLRAGVQRVMDENRLDALVHPTWSNPPRLIGDLNTPAGDNSQIFAPTTGWPAIQVPMGYTRGTLPAGLTFFGPAWSEETLIRFAYSYEQATRHRRPPASVPPLR
jgi:amidase